MSDFGPLLGLIIPIVIVCILVWLFMSPKPPPKL